MRRCWPTPADRLPGRGRWLHEVKWDGYRVLARLEGGVASLDQPHAASTWASRFAAVARALPHALRTSDCVVDGELCALDEQGRPSFSLLQRGEGSPAYYLFDLLELERRPLIDQPLEQRREQLAELLVEGNPLVRLSAGFEDGAALLQAVARAGPGGRGGQAAGLALPAGPADSGLGEGEDATGRRVPGARLDAPARAHGRRWERWCWARDEGSDLALGRQRRQRAGRAQHHRAAAPDGAAASWPSRRSIRCRRCPRRRPGW